MPTKEELQQLPPEDLQTYLTVIKTNPTSGDALYQTLLNKRAAQETQLPKPPKKEEAKPREKGRADVYIPPARQVDYYGPAYKAMQQVRASPKIAGEGSYERAQEVVRERIEQPVSGTGFTATPQYGTGEEGWIAAVRPQRITGEQADILTARRSASGQEVEGMLRNQAIKNLARKRDVDAAEIRRELAQEGNKETLISFPGVSLQRATERSTADVVDAMTRQLEQGYVE